jgi:hypothetical protein
MIEPLVALGLKLPEPVLNEIDLEAPFPIETFPLAVQEFCEDVGRVTQAPIEFSASLCLGVLSACLGKGVVIPNAFNKTIAGIFFNLEKVTSSIPSLASDKVVGIL